MPWNSNSGGPKGGGPWGSGGGGGGNNPWGSGGNRGGGPFGGPRPPDIEDLIRRGQDKLRNIIPGGFGSAPGIVMVVLAVILIWVVFGFFRVQTSEQAIKMVFGRPIGAPVGEGLSWNWAWPIGSVIKQDVLKQTQVFIGDSANGPRGGRTPQRSTTRENLMLTGDENIVNVNFGIVWQIKDITQFTFNTRDPEGTVRTAAESAMRQVIGKSELQFALGEGRVKIEQETREELQRILDFYGTGIRVTQLQLQSVDPPNDVVLGAFRDVQAARADKERKINEANGYRNEIVPQAKGAAEAQVQAAEAYRTEVVNRSQGDAQRFISVYTQYSVAKDITMQRIYLETMEEVLRSANKVLVDRNGSGVVPYLPLPEIQKRAGSPGPSSTVPGQGGTR